MHIKRIHEMIESLTECTKEAIESDQTCVGSYVKIFARTYGTTIEEATETRMCKEYKKYCEEVFSVGIPDEISNK